MHLLTALLVLALVLSSPAPAALGASSDDIRTSDRLEVLENLHGYFPCMDCHEGQETNATPRFLVDEHAEPLEWQDEEGNTRFVPFGERVSFAQLLGKTAARDLRSQNLARIGERLNAAAYMEENGYSLGDSVYAPIHGGANLWCLDCHSSEDYNSLRKLNGELLTFNQSQFLCGQCHGPILKDWEFGAHGRTNGYWNREMDTGNESIRMLCVECHIPHAPAFASRMPKPGPVPRIDNISNPVGEVHMEVPGKRDDLGPHPWEKDKAKDTKKEDH